MKFALGCNTESTSSFAHHCYPDTALYSIPSCFKVLIHSHNGFWKYFSKLIQVLSCSHGKSNHLHPPAGSWGRTPRIHQDTPAFLTAPFCTNRTTPKPQQNTSFPYLFPAQPCTATTCHMLSIIPRNTFPHRDLEEASICFLSFSLKVHRIKNTKNILGDISGEK